MDYFFINGNLEVARDGDEAGPDQPGNLPIMAMYDRTLKGGVVHQVNKKGAQDG